MNKKFSISISEKDLNEVELKENSFSTKILRLKSWITILLISLETKAKLLLSNPVFPIISAAGANFKVLRCGV